ncbi:hypothetical protein [Ornithinibacillus contaminans]|uniref:hypothetical protein n=1 Tax=Ornithinibacillus contaminans TaxID=694055 RepID=UPI00064D7A3D|nr:hypothetical protein [Ornithinibacillus contaminans]
MKEFKLTKLLGITVGVLTVVIAIGYGFLAFIALGLSNAWDDGQSNSSDENFVMFVIITLLVIGLVTAIGAMKLENRVWRSVYFSCCLIIGIGTVIYAFIAFGALGWKNELFLLVVGLLYLLLGYLVKGKR